MILEEHTRRATREITHADLYERLEALEDANRHLLTRLQQHENEIRKLLTAVRFLTGGSTDPAVVSLVQD